MYNILTHKAEKRNKNYINHLKIQNQKIMSVKAMNHYVRQQITSGTHIQNIGDYSAHSLKDIVLHIMQEEFKKKYNNLKYNITSERSDLLDKEQFYRSGLTYEQIKSLSEDDIQDLCLMITTDKNRDSLNYIRICPYLHKNPISIKQVQENDKIYNKPIKPIKLKIMPGHLLGFTFQTNKNVMLSMFYIKPELAKVYGLKQTLTQTSTDVYNHVYKVLTSAGINLENIDYNKIPKPIYNAMKTHSAYFSSDRKTSYHKNFKNFFRDYFKNQNRTLISLGFTKSKYKISPFLASYISLDPTKTYDYHTILITLQNKYPQHKLKSLKELLYVSKENFIRNYKFNYEDIMKHHTLIADITEDNMIQINKKYIKYKYENVLKSGQTLQRFYRNIVKPKLHPPPPPKPEVVKVAPESPKTPASATSSTSTTSTEDDNKESSEEEETSDED